MDLVEESEDELVFGVEAEGGGGEEDITDIGSALTGVGVEGEDCVQLSNVVSTEDRVFGSDVLGKDCLKILLLELSL